MLVTLKKTWDAQLGQMVNTTVSLELNMKSAVNSYNNLPLAGDLDGDARIVLDTKQIYVWKNGTWNTQGHIDMDTDLLQAMIQSLS